MVPIITDWLQRLIKQSKTAQELDFAVLREVYGLSVDFTKLPKSHAQQYMAQLDVYGVRVCINIYVKVKMQYR